MVKLSIRMGRKYDLSHLNLMLLKSGFPEEQETKATVHTGIKTGQQKIGKTSSGLMRVSVSAATFG